MENQDNDKKEPHATSKSVSIQVAFIKDFLELSGFSTTPAPVRRMFIGAEPFNGIELGDGNAEATIEKATKSAIDRNRDMILSFIVYQSFQC